jgi:hypothetical protein
MSLSEEGSIVFCIVAHSANRSTFFEGGVEVKAKAQKVHTPAKRLRTNWRYQSWH